MPGDLTRPSLGLAERRYHLDVDAADAFRARRRTLLLTVFAATLVAIAVLWWLGKV